MPIGRIRGNAVFSWTDSDDTMTERVLVLREPVREIRPAHTQEVYVADSLNRQTRQTFTVGEGADELVVRVRFGDDPQGLLDLIKAGTKSRTITYVPDTTDGDVRYSCLLISPLSPTQLGLDQDRGTEFGDVDVELVLRKTDQTPFLGVLDNPTLFEFRAGGRIEEATYSRASVASYPALAGGGGYGTLTTAASGAARLAWYSTASSAGPRAYPALVLEDQRTNRITQGEGGSSQWTGISAGSQTTGQTDPRGGSAAWLMGDASTSAQAARRITLTLTASTRAVGSFWAKAGTTSHANGSEFILRSTNGASTYLRMNVAWSSQRPTVTMQRGTHLTPVDRWRGGWFRFGMRTTANLTTGSYHFHIFPAMGGGTTAKGNVYVFGVQVEE